MGRFKTIRKLYKIFKINKKQTLIIDATNEEYINSDLNENLIINEIEKNGFYNNIQLDHTTLNYIKNLCSRYSQEELAKITISMLVKNSDLSQKLKSLESE